MQWRRATAQLRLASTPSIARAPGRPIHPRGADVPRGRRHPEDRAGDDRDSPLRRFGTVISSRPSGGSTTTSRSTRSGNASINGRCTSPTDTIGRWPRSSCGNEPAGRRAPACPRSCSRRTLRMLAFHRRVVGPLPMSVDEFAAPALRERVTVEEVATQPVERGVFGLYVGGRWYRLVPPTGRCGRGGGVTGCLAAPSGGAGADLRVRGSRRPWSGVRLGRGAPRRVDQASGRGRRRGVHADATDLRSVRGRGGPARADAGEGDVLRPEAAVGSLPGSKRRGGPHAGRVTRT